MKSSIEIKPKQWIFFVLKTNLCAEKYILKIKHFRKCTECVDNKNILSAKPFCHCGCKFARENAEEDEDDDDVSEPSSQ